MAMSEDPSHLHAHSMSNMSSISALTNPHQLMSPGGLSSAVTPSVNEKPKKKTAYSIFMVQESKRLRAQHPDLTHAELMKMVGDAWAQHPENPRAGEPRKKRTWSSRSKKARMRQVEEAAAAAAVGAVVPQGVKRGREDYSAEDNTDASNEYDEYDDEEEEEDSEEDDDRIGRVLGRLIARKVSRMIRRAFAKGEESAYRKLNIEPPYPLSSSPARRADFQTFALEEAKRLQGMFPAKTQQEIMKMVQDSWAQSSLNPKNRKRKKTDASGSTPTAHALMSTPKPYGELLTDPSALHTEDHMKGPHDQQHYGIDFGDSDSSRYDQRKGAELGGLTHGAL